MKSIEEKTLNDLREGNHKAFEEVFVAYFDRIKQFIFGYIKSDFDAEELTEDIFVKLWINRRTIDPTKAFNSYLHTVARNAALNFLKHKLVKESHTEIHQEQTYHHNPEDELIAKETQLLIEMAVEKMPQQRRLVYQLSRNEGLKNDEIAVRLHITKNNVESLLSLALKDLRKVISTVCLLFP